MLFLCSNMMHLNTTLAPAYRSLPFLSASSNLLSCVQFLLTYYQGLAIHSATNPKLFVRYNRLMFSSPSSSLILAGLAMLALLMPFHPNVSHCLFKAQQTEATGAWLANFEFPLLFQSRWASSASDQ